MPDDLKVSAVYDRRFGLVQFDFAGVFRLALKSLVETLNVDPGDLAAVLDPRYQWTEGTADIQDARLRVLTETLSVGKVVLDVGGYDGWAAKRLLNQGASRAVCLDNQQYEHYGWTEKRLEGVEYVTGSFMGWTEPVDVLVFYNVLYHLKNPWAALDHLREIVKPDGQMLLCTLFRYHDGAWMYVYEPRECNPTDETVYWGPSLQALERLLKATGWNFTQEGLAYDRVVYRCRPMPGFQRTHGDT